MSGLLVLIAATLLVGISIGRSVNEKIGKRCSPVVDHPIPLTSDTYLFCNPSSSSVWKWALCSKPCTLPAGSDEPDAFFLPRSALDSESVAKILDNSDCDPAVDVSPSRGVDKTHYLHCENDPQRPGHRLWRMHRCADGQMFSKTYGKCVTDTSSLRMYGYMGYMPAGYAYDYGMMNYGGMGGGYMDPYGGMGGGMGYMDPYGGMMGGGGYAQPMMAAPQPMMQAPQPMMSGGPGYTYTGHLAGAAPGNTWWPGLTIIPPPAPLPPGNAGPPPGPPAPGPAPGPPAPAPNPAPPAVNPPPADPPPNPTAGPAGGLKPPTLPIGGGGIKPPGLPMGGGKPKLPMGKKPLG